VCGEYDDDDDDEEEDEDAEPGDNDDALMARLAVKGLDADALACGVAHGDPKGGVLQIDEEDPGDIPDSAANAAGDAPVLPPAPLQILVVPAAKAVEPDPATIPAAPAAAAGSPVETAPAGGTPEKEGASQAPDQLEGDQDRDDEAGTPAPPKKARRRAGIRRKSPKKKRAKVSRVEANPVTPAPPDPNRKYLEAAVKARNAAWKANTGTDVPQIPGTDPANITDIPEPVMVSRKTATAPVTGTGTDVPQSPSLTSGSGTCSSASGSLEGSPVTVQSSGGRSMRSKGPAKKDTGNF
jgi:hypothetical protein